MKYKYLVVFEEDSKSIGAFVPDLPGCVAVARSLPRVKKLIREAIAMHLEDMLERGQRPPKPRTKSEYVETQAA